MLEFCNGLFTTKKDKYCWILEEKTIGQDKNGNEKEKIKETYHANLKQVCSTIIDRRAGDCDNLQVLIELIKDAETMLTDKAKELNAARKPA